MNKLVEEILAIIVITVGIITPTFDSYEPPSIIIKDENHYEDKCLYTSLREFKPSVLKISEDNKTIYTNLTDDEKDLLSRLVSAEAIGEPYEGKVAVAIVVLNRVDSDNFPNDIKSVIYQPKQFSPVSNGAINRIADKKSIEAVEEAVNIDRNKSELHDSLFFYNPEIATSRWLDTRVTTVVIGNHVFKN